MLWRKPKLECVGSALFRGALPPRLEEFLPSLAAAGIDVTPHERVGTYWAASLRHPTWGTAEASCQRDMPRVPPSAVASDHRLSPDERQAATAAQHCVSVHMQVPHGDALRDRKRLLRFLQLFANPFDPFALVTDHFAQRFWSKTALEDELQHDADLDIESVFVTHLVLASDDPDERRIAWLHTHGLDMLGAYDFDILAPDRLFTESGYDAIRGLAFALLEGLAPDSDPVTMFEPGGLVRLVPVDTFMRQAPEAERAVRTPSEDHAGRRVVVCEHGAAGWLGRLFRRTPVRAARCVQQVDGDHFVTPFSNAASDLMAARARLTVALGIGVQREFAADGVTMLVKLGVTIDGAASQQDREHMWFEVHEFPDDSTVDATLLNEPFHIARLRAGQRGKFGLELLTDWTIMTPAGSITPRNLGLARRLRQALDETAEQHEP